MKIILSPAKRMNISSDLLDYRDLPVFLEKAEVIMDWLKAQSYGELKRLWVCNDGIAEQNYERLCHMDLRNNLTAAILSYDGIAYQYMAPAVFETGQFEYIQENLRILSGFYGILKPMDGVTPYRLEMQARARIEGKRNLYDYWGDLLYKEVVDDSRIIINLASKEYSKCIEKYLQQKDVYITCVFGELVKDKVVQKGVYAKMARGEMVRFMAENRITEPEKIKEFAVRGYCFEEKLSSETEYIFLRGRHPQFALY